MAEFKVVLIKDLKWSRAKTTVAISFVTRNCEINLPLGSIIMVSPTKSLAATSDTETYFKIDTSQFVSI